MVLSLQMKCPPMKVTRVGPGLRRTAVENMVFKVTEEDGTVVATGTCVIPETDVNWIGPGHWRVRECVGIGDGLVVKLPAEDVWANLVNWSYDAVEMPNCETHLNVAVISHWGGTTISSYSGTTDFPLCHTDIFTGIAEAVIATGELS